MLAADLNFHRVFLEMKPVLHCASCGATFALDETQAAVAHLANGGPKTLAEPSTPYPCTNCERAFASEQGLAVHKARVHKVLPVTGHST